MFTSLDLTTQAPRSPHTRVGGYSILGRTIDKGRALANGNIGDYHYDCPLDNILFGFKGITGDELKNQINAGASDEEIVSWLNTAGTPKTAEEITAWSDSVEAINPYNSPEKRQWFTEQCEPLGLDPSKTTLFQWLDVDDKASYAA
jgi:hypothetical protein